MHLIDIHNFTLSIRRKGDKTKDISSFLNRINFNAIPARKKILLTICARNSAYLTILNFIWNSVEKPSELVDQTDIQTYVLVSMDIANWNDVRKLWSFCSQLR